MGKRAFVTNESGETRRLSTRVPRLRLNCIALDLGCYIGLQSEMI